MTSTTFPSLTGHYLRIDRGDDARFFRLDRPVVHLGGGFTADVRLDNATVARRHATLVRDGHRTVILDDGSADGTLVNGQRSSRSTLTSGDVVRLGAVELTYLDLT
jgi:pSer/pThr/pTyr-binding forkhead associated (FHA) protein